MCAERSPDVIAARLKMEYDDIRMRVSIETIYRWVYRDAHQGGQLFKFLCRSHREELGSDPEVSPQIMLLSQCDVVYC